MRDERVAGQLGAIEEAVRVAGELGVGLWLRGGWAMDFFLGEVTREHRDIDWFAWHEEAPRLVTVLAGRGWRLLPEPPHDEQLDLERDGIEQSVTLLGRDDAGCPVVPAGAWAGEPWPEDLLDGPPGELAGIVCPIVSPRAQVEIKRMMPVWNPDLPRRAKDAEDIERIEAALRRI
ncbi:aminoglycoside adenylyltransferase [Actinoplanes sp. NPDC051851]|uniref:nucleotidyltransferase domain-containing protein n=1 Tax=Actinoplanes sp. NPDC051851 TaxID=3154753 RepID=UPI00341C4231